MREGGGAPQELLDAAAQCTGLVVGLMAGVSDDGPPDSATAPTHLYRGLGGW